MEHEMSSAPDNHLTLFQQYRPLLFSIAYQMLGSAMEAEDILQDAYLRFLPVPLRTVESPRAYLSAIITRLCLNQLASARVQRESYVGPWLPEPILDANYPELTTPDMHVNDYESVSLAFLALLERLTPAERAVFLLREVFDYEYHEIAEMLDKSQTACRKLFSRAKSYIATNRPRFTPSPEEHRRLLTEFMTAVGNGNLSGLTEMLAEDITFWADGGGKAPGAALKPVRGRDDVARFVLAVTARHLPQDAQFTVANVNSLPTLLIRHPDGEPALVVSIEADPFGIHNIWVIANPDKLKAVKNGI